MCACVHVCAGQSSAGKDEKWVGRTHVLWFRVILYIKIMGIYGDPCLEFMLLRFGDDLTHKNHADSWFCTTTKPCTE